MEQKMNIVATSEAPRIALNEPELRAWAEGIAAKYTGLVVTEEQVPAIRKDMAELNDLADKLDKARIATVREVSAPIREFEDKVKSIRAIILDTRKVLADQVAGYEERARQEKQKMVQELITKTKGERMVPGLDIPIQASWLTKSATRKSILEAVNDIINAHLTAVKLKEDLARAKQERAMAVEAKVGELNQAHGLELTVSIFVDCLDVELPLVDAFERMEAHYSAKAAEAARSQAEREAQGKAAFDGVVDAMLGQGAHVGVDPAKPGYEQSILTSTDGHMVLTEKGRQALDALAQATGADQANPILDAVPMQEDQGDTLDVSAGLTPPPPVEYADKLLTVTALVPAGQVDAVKGILRRLFAYCADVKISIE